MNRHWAYNFLGRIKFGRRKTTTSKSRYAPEDFAAMKKGFLEDVTTVVTMEDQRRLEAIVMLRNCHMTVHCPRMQSMLKNAITWKIS